MRHDSIVMLAASPLGSELVLANGITEEVFLKHFPVAYSVRALTPWEVSHRGLDPDRTWWLFVQDFVFVSDVWGAITIPAGFVTDFASVPLALHSLYDDDSPILLLPSAPHDWIFAPRTDGTRGWLPDGRRLTLTQANNVLTEAMWYCGASARDRADVFLAVAVGNHSIRNQFAPEAAPAS